VTRRAFAPAKVNLFLHVGPLGSDGYHPLESWMVFADIGDVITLEQGAPYRLDITGPYAGAVPTTADNLVLRARDAAMDQPNARIIRFGLTLEKNLPPASGLGGGSSDAAATLRLMGEYLALPAVRLAQIAATLGADVPACLQARGLMARGRGEKLGPAPDAPPLDAVLVNPGIETATGAVFAQFDRQSGAVPLEAEAPDRLEGAEAVAAFLARQRNDLEAAAVTLHPQINIVLAALASAPEALIARMSGSGATCFALCRDPSDARALGARLAAEHPGWWVRACTLA